MIDMKMNVVGLIATVTDDTNLRKKAVAAACDKNELIWREMMMMVIQKQVGAPQIQLIP